MRDLVAASRMSYRQDLKPRAALGQSRIIKVDGVNCYLRYSRLDNGKWEVVACVGFDPRFAESEVYDTGAEAKAHYETMVSQYGGTQWPDEI